MISLYKLNTDFKSRVLGSGAWIDGKYIHELEEALKSYLDIPYVALTNSGTSALLAAYWVLTKDCKKLTVDPYTFPATYQPARLLAYDIEFIKSVQQEGQSYASKELSTITHLFGQPNHALDNPSRLFIEDSCQSFGAEHNHKKIGTFGTFGCFSFYPTKSLHTCGHGGALVTSDKAAYESARTFIESGRKNGVMTQEIALNLRMDEVRAEFLLQELQDYDEKNSVQHGIARQYMQLIPGPQPYLEEASHDRHVYSVFNMLIEQRDEFRQYMQSKGIQTMIYYDESILPPGQRASYKTITSRIVAIPCRYNLTPKEVITIKEALKGWFS